MGPPLQSSAVADARLADGAPPHEEKEQPLSKRHRKSDDGSTKNSSHTDSDDRDGRGDITASDYAQSRSEKRKQEHEGSVPAAFGVAPAASAEEEKEQDQNGGDIPIIEDDAGDYTDGSRHDREDEEEEVDNGSMEEDESEGDDQGEAESEQGESAAEQEIDGENEGTADGEGDREEGRARAAAGEADDGEVKISRARSAWMIFLASNREKVRQDNPGLAVGPMQKILSSMWKGLSEDESARYAKLATEEKSRMKKLLADAGLTRLPAKKSAPTSTLGSMTDLVLPLARVRKTVRLDPAVGNISKEALQLVAKATEIFIEHTAERAWRIGRQTGRKSVKPCDLADYVFASPEMYWLRDDFRSERSSVTKNANKLESSGKGPVGKKPVPPLANGAKAITSFFQKA